MVVPDAAPTTVPDAAPASVPPSRLYRGSRCPRCKVGIVAWRRHEKGGASLICPCGWMMYWDTSSPFKPVGEVPGAGACAAGHADVWLCRRVGGRLDLLCGGVNGTLLCEDRRGRSLGAPSGFLGPGRPRGAPNVTKLSVLAALWTPSTPLAVPELMAVTHLSRGQVRGGLVRFTRGRFIFQHPRAVLAGGGRGASWSLLPKGRYWVISACRRGLLSGNADKLEREAAAAGLLGPASASAPSGRPIAEYDSSGQTRRRVVARALTPERQVAKENALELRALSWSQTAIARRAGPVA